MIATLNINFIGCALPNLPGVYTDVAVYNNWIDETIIWDSGEHEHIPTPTTVMYDNASDSNATVLSLCLIAVYILVLIISK